MGADLKARSIANQNKSELAFITGDINSVFLPIWIDTVGKTLQIWGVVTLYSKQGKYIIPTVSPYSWSYVANDEDIMLIYFDPSDSAIKIANTKNTTIGNKIPITFFNNMGYLHGNAHAIKFNGVTGTEMPYYDWDSSNAFVMPNNYYFIKDYVYSLASQNFNKAITYSNPNLLYEIHTDMYIDRFVNSCKLQFKTIGLLTSRLSGIKGSNFVNALWKELNINVSNTTKTQTTPKVLCIGDSITHRQFIYFIKKWLTDLGINPTLLGTMLNLTDTAATVLGEGRQGWRSTDFTGVCTHDGVPFPASNAVNSNFTNPFLSAGLFNFGYYMTQQVFASVDYVVIMIGTNDITNYSELGVAPTVPDSSIPTNVYNSISTMITSIHAYNPAIKIAVVPPVLGGMYLNKNKLYLEVAEKLIYEFDNLKVANVYLIASYLSTGIMSSKEPLTGTPFSAINNTQKAGLPVDVHDTIGGARVNALWSASWIMNMLT